MTYAQRLTDKRITRAIMEYDLIDEGDRILVALSGGKDSLALAWNLSRKARGFPVSFEAEALHLVTAFAPAGQPRVLSDLLTSWDMKLTLMEQPTESAAFSGNPPTCFGCARDRRRLLLTHAAEEGFTKVALGHHMDDSLITLLMNMSWNGELAAMPPKLSGREPGAPAIIRPLILLQENVVARMVKDSGWPVEPCGCPWAGDSRRIEAAAWLEMITDGSPERKLNLWKSLTSQKTDLLPQPTGSA
jgi:tRNA 2-thiocytidine biosynthesis protein TtcA